jgi:endonuclease G
MASRKKTYRKVTRKRDRPPVRINLKHLAYILTFFFGTTWITSAWNRVTNNSLWQQASNVVYTKLQTEINKLPQQTTLNPFPTTTDSHNYPQNNSPQATQKQTPANAQNTRKGSLAMPAILPEEESQVVKHQYYTLLYNEEHEQAEWVAYKLTKGFIQGSAERQNDFRPDPAVRTGSALPDDYRGSSYDRGHLAPAADFHCTAAAMSETFFMSNMSPQKHEFNDGIWKHLEERVRFWVKRDGDLYVVAGPVLTDNLRKIGRKNKVSVPEYYFKMILNPKTYKAIAFLMPNRLSYKHIAEYVVSINEIERLTERDFFSNLPDDIEQKIEKSSDTKGWF